MTANEERLRTVIVGFYAWVTAIFAGGILLDIVYSRPVSGMLSSVERTTVFSAVSDFLLLIGGVTILAALGAIAASWGAGMARYLLIASLLVLGLELIVPVFVFRIVPNAQDLSFGPWLRLTISSLASGLAFIGAYSLHRQERRAL